MGQRVGDLRIGVWGIWTSLIGAVTPEWAAIVGAGADGFDRFACAIETLGFDSLAWG